MTNRKRDPESEPEYHDWMPTSPDAKPPPAAVIATGPKFDPRTGMWFQGNRRVPAPGSGRGRVAASDFTWSSDRDQ